MVSKEQAVIDMSKIIYTPQQKLKFYDDPKNGKRAPLYIWKPKVLSLTNFRSLLIKGNTLNIPLHSLR